MHSETIRLARTLAVILAVAAGCEARPLDKAGGTGGADPAAPSGENRTPDGAAKGQGAGGSSGAVTGGVSPGVAAGGSGGPPIGLAAAGGSVPWAGGQGGSDGGASDGRSCPCSRRPGEDNSWMCPPGTGKVVTAAIGPEGGTLQLDGTPATRGTPFRLVIPAGALAQTVTIQLTESTVPVPTPYVDDSPIFDLQPKGLTFTTPVALSIPYQNVQGVVPRELSAYADTAGAFARLTDSLDIGGVITASTTRLGAVFAGYPRSAADDAACAAGTGAGGSSGNDGRACPCSRRSGENNSTSCPAGAGKTVSVAVGPAGGAVALSGTASTLGVPFQLVIAPNALATTVTIQVTESTTPPPEPYVDESPIYVLEPAGLTFAIAPLLYLPFQNVGGVVPRAVAAYASTDTGVTYAPLGDSYQNAGFLMASLPQLGMVFAGYPREAADDLACMMMTAP